MKWKKQNLIYPALTVGIAAADQIFKAAARRKLPEGESVPLREICPIHRRRYMTETITRRNEPERAEETDRTRGEQKRQQAEILQGKGREPEQKAPVIYLYNSRNRGAAMNLLDQHPGFVGGVSAGMTAALSGILVYDLFRSGHRVQKAGLALLLGGAYSNTIDRVKDHAVTDYINFRVGPSCLKNTVFNLGDFAIAVGAILAAGGSAD